jgi:hypothetical protein
MIFKTNQNIFQVNILQNENEVIEWNFFCKLFFIVYVFIENYILIFFNYIFFQIQKIKNN